MLVLRRRRCLNGLLLKVIRILFADRGKGLFNELLLWVLVRVLVRIILLILLWHVMQVRSRLRCWSLIEERSRFRLSYRVHWFVSSLLSVCEISWCELFRMLLMFPLLELIVLYLLLDTELVRMRWNRLLEWLLTSLGRLRELHWGHHIWTSTTFETLLMAVRRFNDL